MYNFDLMDRETIVTTLKTRFSSFEEQCDVKDPSSLRRFVEERDRIEEGERTNYLKVCSFLGCLNGGKVGCLLHPSRHGGVDLRSEGIYEDREICERYFCRAAEVLGRFEVELVVRACEGDSFLYGLVISDAVMVIEMVEALKILSGQSFKQDAAFDPRVLKKVRSFLDWKTDWPHQDPEIPLAGAVIPHRSAPVVQNEGRIAGGGMESILDFILGCLGSSFEDEEEEEEARALLFGSLYDIKEAFIEVLAESGAETDVES